MGKHLRKNTKKLNIPLRVAIMLLCLGLFSAYFVTGLFARYAASAQGSDQARVAKFSIVGDGTLLEPITAEFVPGSSQEVDLVIENDSEVSVEYTVEVTNATKNLPLSFRIKKDASESTGDANGIKLTAQRLPGRHTDNYMLTIDWPAAAGNPDKMGMTDYIMITVTAVQID